MTVISTSVPPYPYEEIPAENIGDALNLINDFRVAFGESVLDDLLPGIASSGHHCILAKSLNFEVYVSPQNASVWEASSQNREHIQKLSELIGNPMHEYPSSSDIGGRPSRWAVILPESVGIIAHWFDNYHLPDRYYLTDDE